MLTKEAETVRQETLKAYADFHGDLPFEKTKLVRNLHFKASHPVNKITAKAILSEAIEEGYNAFESGLIDKFPDDAKIIIAREYSVCLYVKSKEPLPSASDLGADEFDENDWDGYTRIWWD